MSESLNSATILILREICFTRSIMTPRNGAARKFRNSICDYCTVSHRSRGKRCWLL